MRERLYKFEDYPDRDFPVYLSVQQGRKYLAHLHFHEEAEVMYVLSGTVTLRAGREYIHCSASEAVYIPPLTLHEIQAETPDASIRGLVFDLSLICAESLHTDYVPLFRESSPFHFTKGSGELAAATVFTEQIAQAYPKKADLSKIEILSALYGLFALFMKYGIIRNSGASATNYLRIRPAVEYIEKNFNQKITVSQLSELLSVCDDHCIRLFKAAVSKTPTEYITDVRLRQGLKLLTDQKYSVQMISELCGFSNVSYFSRVFREKLGMTPSEFRRSV